MSKLRTLHQRLKPEYRKILENEVRINYTNIYLELSKCLRSNTTIRELKYGTTLSLSTFLVDKEKRDNTYIIFDLFED